MALSEQEALAINLLSRLNIVHPTAPEEAIAILKQIKYALIGHDQAKLLYVERNLVPTLVKLLRDDHGHQELKLEAAICIGSLAYGGEKFASELLREGVLPPLITALNISISHSKLVLTCLRTLNTLFDTCPLEASATSNSIAGAITSEIYSNRLALKYIEKILCQTSPSPCTQQQISLAATLVSKTCSHGGSGEKAAANMEKHQTLLISSGISEALGKRLAGFIVRNRNGDDETGIGGNLITPRPANVGSRHSISHDDEDKENNVPPPAPVTAKLAPILDALSVIFKNNHHRAQRFLKAPWILSAFPAQMTAKSSKPKPKGAASTPRNVPQPTSPSHLSSSQFPTLAAAARYYHGGAGHYSEPADMMGDMDSSSNTPAPGSDTEEASRKDSKRKRNLDQVILEESPLIQWLISTVRTGDALTRLMATSLLTNLCQVRLTGPIVKSLEDMVLPVLVRLLDEEPQSSPPPEYHKGGAAVGGYELPQQMEWVIRERAPAVLADLVNNSDQLQKAAVDAHAIKKLAGMFKRTFEVTNSSSGKETNGIISGKSHDASWDEEITKGAEVNTPYKIHRMKVRESTLRCLAGITSLKDEYRKVVIESGIVPYIVLSLRPMSEKKIQDPGPSNTPTDGTTAEESNPNIVKEGNPPRVLIAAAYAIRSLSRSVSILRTNLVDAGVAVPLMELLKDDDVEVKNAATMALCNLVLEFSPMRQTILDMGILKILCEQAHSSNAELKLNSVWALKHLVYAAENEVKTTALAQLGSGWLVDLISWDDDLGSDDEDEYDEEGMDEPDFESLGNKPEYPQEEDSGDESDFNRMKDSIGQLSHPQDIHHPVPEDGPSSAASPAHTHESPSRAMRRARRQLLDVQEQGFNFIRNLICGGDSGEILDILFTGVGQNRVYDILARKLRPKPVAAHSTRRPTTASSTESSTPHSTTFRTPTPEILVPVIYILVHIAANHPRHRQTLIEQTDLLKAVLPLFNHEHTEVRVGLAWLVINLTWKDDGADEASCRARASELKRLGFVHKMEQLLHDKALDVRERAKTGLYQIKTCLGEV